MFRYRDIYMQLHPLDTVATALQDLQVKMTLPVHSQGEEIHITIKEPIPYGFKFSLVQIYTGERIIKFGEPMGQATREIPPGSLVHVQNVEGLRVKA